MKLIVKKHLVAVLMLFVVAVLLNGGVIWAVEDDIISEDTQARGKQELREVDKFQYKIEGRSDPFLPFLSKDSGRDEIDDTPIENEKGKPLTGMQLFEPGQLRLVALLKIGNRNVAMVEDVAGKGYRLDENMLIGRHGTINRITDERIEITESYTTKTGRVVTKEIIMRLKKEGDK
ncbi:MAG: pilus assembly protein PilP [Candidatus Electrothrix sp. Rat3]|nr:pilus assembly protein PilP [Candidatus Electrothrix rattekaaiensis]